MSLLVEREIQKVFTLTANSEAVSDHLISWCDGSISLQSIEHIEAIALFLVKSQQYQKLVSWIFKHLRDEQRPIPWAALLQSISLGLVDVPQYLVQDLREGMREQQSFLDAARAKDFDHYWEDLEKWRLRIPSEFQQKLEAKRQNLFAKLSTFRTARLPQEEKKVIQTLESLFPSDPEIQKLHRDHTERYAMDVIQKALKRKSLYTESNGKQNSSQDSGQSSSSITNDPSTEVGVIASQMKDLCFQEQSLALDFAIAASAMEDYQTALDCLQMAPEGLAKDWMQPELLLKLNRNLDALIWVEDLEKKYAQDPDCFIATAYLRSQALFALGQKKKAISILENLLQSQPEYRAASAFLKEWKSK